MHHSQLWQWWQPPPHWEGGKCPVPTHRSSIYLYLPLLRDLVILCHHNTSPPAGRESLLSQLGPPLLASLPCPCEIESEASVYFRKLFHLKLGSERAQMAEDGPVSPVGGGGGGSCIRV